MTARGRRVALAIGLLTALLFLGRWGTTFLAERWWAASVSGAAAVFTTRWTLLRIGLDAAGIGLSVAWFVAHLLVAARLATRAAAGGGDDPPGPAPLREDLLRWWSLGTAAILGLLCGAGTSSWAPTVALAAARPRWGITDPMEGMDAGFYVAILPLLLQVVQWLLALTLLGFLAVLMLYAIGGALRIAARRFVLDPGIRLHLGLLGASLAAVVGLGHLLEPYELAAGLRPSIGAAHALLLGSLSWVLVGFAFAAAALTAWWGVRGRIMVPVGAWASYALFALVIRLLAPAAGAVAEGDRPAAEARDLEREAFRIPDVLEQLAAAILPASATAVEPRLWDARTVAAESGPWVAAEEVLFPSATGGRSALLLVGAGQSGGLQTVVVAADRASPTGGPLVFRGDSTTWPGVAALSDVAAAIHQPAARGLRLAATGEGVPAGGLLQRLALTWALQSNLLGADPADRVAWRLDPRERLAAVAPFVEWGSVQPRILGDRILWFADGYLFAEGFPGVAPAAWRGRAVSYLRAGYVGVVDATTGAVRLFERGSPDPMVAAWSALARGLVEPDSAMPAAWRAELHYPAELFAAQANVLQRAHWQFGSLARPAAGLPLDTLGGPVLRAAYTTSDGRRIRRLVEAEYRGGADRLRVIPVDSALGTAAPAVLAPLWERLPFVQQTRDSVLALGARFQLGPVRLAPSAEGIVAWQTGHAVDSLGRATLVLVNLAHGTRVGTGTSYQAAWSNLRGETAALPGSLAADVQLQAAREWLARADSAFRRGDLAAFGRAFDALRAILERPPGRP